MSRESDRLDIPFYSRKLSGEKEPILSAGHLSFIEETRRIEIRIPVDRSPPGDTGPFETRQKCEELFLSRAGKAGLEPYEAQK
jgi:hypothetical protein